MLLAYVFPHVTGSFSVVFQVIIYRLLAVATIDEKIFQRQVRKQEVGKSVIKCLYSNVLHGWCFLLGGCMEVHVVADVAI
jgi:hypothetical protein